MGDAGGHFLAKLDAEVGARDLGPLFWAVSNLLMSCSLNPSGCMGSFVTAVDIFAQLRECQTRVGTQTIVPLRPSRRGRGWGGAGASFSAKSCPAIRPRRKV